ncbi:RagB/SusD family nutrient uptake outer membrane protein [Aliifodinibius sp. S!AR15-10]|uniref:RagB/SusD family nutrient uptake outer membrane protein n=1 Tax=Aliifodinibius sp. S!AR15-10 TaxID=2950437 RepID=UPI00286611B4|nr:RagB/SusD family nutrient uptake outer membrane protein [Aliifodinibius sp. S!AR15-10]MDR8394532.1 RagB/SusD family nutrient uptake outer membrane protein [Aliifodinibius sp. S!AR15-10]
MKKLKLLILLIGSLFLFNGCDTGLDPQIYDQLNPTTYPSNAKEAELYALEVYYPFTSRWPTENYQIFGLEEGHIQQFDAPTDVMTQFTEWGGFFQDYSRANYDNFTSYDRRRSHLEYIRFVTETTKIIDDLQNLDVFANEEERNQLLGEVRMARGWIMYYMLHLYGPVPVILDPAKIGTEAEADMTRPSRGEYVNAIANDLRFAADNLAVDAPDYGRFNKGLALTALMRLYLNEQDFQNAEDIGREIQAMNKYSLIDDYMSLFTESTERNSETIWAISATGSSTGRGNEGNFNAYSYYTLPSDFEAPGVTPGWSSPNAVFMATWDFYDSFDPSDERREQLVESYGSRDRTNLRGAVIFKYPGPGGFTGADIPIARFADVKLMLAESINENNGGPTQEAIDHVNDVRNRAGLGDLPPEDTQSMEAFNDAILEERGKEFLFEGLRKFDLVRHGEWPDRVETIEGKTPTSTPLLPIPQWATQDGMAQNEGY